MYTFTTNDHTSDVAAIETVSLSVPGAADELVTGWEPELTPNDSVLRNYVATLEDRLRTNAGAIGAPVHTTDLAFFVDLDSAYVFDNIVIPRGFLAPNELARVIADARSFFPANRTWTVQALTPAADLRVHGLELIGYPPLMYRPVASTAAPGPVDVEIRPVESVRELRDFEQTLIRAYPLPERSAVVRPEVLDSGFCGFVGYVRGRPVATAGSHTAHGLTEVEWVSVLPNHRGRGFGAAVTHAATIVEPTVPGVLVATDDGRPVYERLGFVPLMRLSIWLHPGST